MQKQLNSRQLGPNCQIVTKANTVRSIDYMVVDVDLGGAYEDDCASTYVVNFVVIATYQWTDKASGEMMMMWVVGSLDRRQGVIQRLPRIT